MFCVAFSVYKFIGVWCLRETLYESDELPKEARDVAALLASKVYYHLGEYDEALSFALGAGAAFEAETRVSGSEEFIETVVCMCNHLPVSCNLTWVATAKAIDRYVELSKTHQKGDIRLKAIIEGIFGRCIAEGEYKQVS